MKGKVVVLLLFLLLLVSFLAFVNPQKSLTKTDAENLVRKLPEVKDKLNNSSGWVVNAEDRHDDYWYIQVAEVINDSSKGTTTGLGHTATFNWYKVDKNNGKIVCSMFNYDENGALKKDNEPNSCL